MPALGWQESLINLLERIADRVVAVVEKRRKLRRHRHLPRQWPLVYPPPPEPPQPADEDTAAPHDHR
jgi:hypothetical protein